MIPENMISVERVCEAAFDLGLVVGPSGIIDVADVIGPMTGLDMAKYEIELVYDARAYRLIRRGSAR